MQYWVIGGKFSSLNFHTLEPQTTIIRGPFKQRSDAEETWKILSEETRHFADFRFIITEEPLK